jgi:hypothetical protein
VPSGPGYISDEKYFAALTARRELRQPEAQATAASEAVQPQRQDAVLAYCKFIRRGLDRLDGTGRQRLLRLLLDRVVVHPRRLEIHGLLQAHDEGVADEHDSFGTSTSQGFPRGALGRAAAAHRAADPPEDQDSREVVPSIAARVDARWVT